jgi:hypothetical protein
MEEWRNGGMAEWRNGGMVEWNVGNDGGEKWRDFIMKRTIQNTIVHNQVRKLRKKFLLGEAPIGLLV